MNSKKYLLNEAERLFLHEFMSCEQIAERLRLNKKTVLAWKEKHDWEKRRCDFIKSKQYFHEELYEFARKLMFGISADMEAGEKIDQGRMYTFCKLIPMFTKVKDYEDIVSQKEKTNFNRGLTPDIVAQIEEEVLGITPNVDKDEIEEE